MSYLILHKVRGEPAFDVATKIQIGDEEGWIIPTSGHRAYPWWTAELSSVLEDAHSSMTNGFLAHKIATLPTDWPDHYEPNARPIEKVNVMALVSGLFPKIKRRL